MVYLAELLVVVTDRLKSQNYQNSWLKCALRTRTQAPR